MADISVDYLVVAGGGGGASTGSGGGAGGMLTGTKTLNGNTNFTITVGGGGSNGASGGANNGVSGSNSVLDTSGTSYSNYFSGSGNYLNIPASTAFDFGTGDVTIEAWVILTAIGGTNQTIISSFPTGSGSGWTAWSFIINTSGYLIVDTFVSGVEQTCIANSNALTINQWYHVAYTRTGGTNRLFVNGNLCTFSSNTLVQAINSGSVALSVSRQNYTGYEYPLKGYVSNLRIVKGTAVYTAAFTPSTVPLTAITNTVLLTCKSATIVDTSTNAFNITSTGTVTISTTTPFGINAIGGGGGVTHGQSVGQNGGSGGGAAITTTGNTPTAGLGVSGQGNNGGGGFVQASWQGSNAGGGGAGGVGGNASSTGGTGGAGAVWAANGVTYAGGGGGGAVYGTNGSGGSGVGGNAGNPGGLGGVNLGGGGGGGDFQPSPYYHAGGAGGSGVVIVRYLTASATVGSSTGGVKTPSGNYTVHTFNSSGTLYIAVPIPGAPVVVTAPVISGSNTIGSTLTSTQGTWTGDATITYAYQWNRDGTAISGATASSYTTVVADLWKLVTCTVTATNSASSLASTSNSIVPGIVATIPSDISQGTASKITPSIVKGDAITVVESMHFSLNTPTAIRVDVGDTYSSFSKIAYQVPKGDDITVVEANHFSLFTPTAIRVDVGDTYSSFSKVNYSLLIGDAITVAEAKHFSLSIGTVRQVGDSFTNLTQLYGWPDRTDNITFNTYTGGGSLTSYEAWYLS